MAWAEAGAEAHSAVARVVQACAGADPRFAEIVAGTVLDALGARSVSLDDGAGIRLATAGGPAATSTAGAPVDVVPLVAAGRPVGRLAVTGLSPTAPGRRLLAPVADAVALGLAARVALDAQRLADAVAGEAADLADALHDGPAQDLVAAGLAAQRVSRAGHDDAGTGAAVAAALADLRRLIWDLRPRAADGGLGPALSALAERLTATGRRLTVVVPEGPPLDGATAEAAYRTVLDVVRATHGPVEVRVEPGAAHLAVQIGLGPADAADATAHRVRDARVRALGGWVQPEPHGLLVLLPTARVAAVQREEAHQ